jgi:hypothetical protein
MQYYQGLDVDVNVNVIMAIMRKKEWSTGRKCHLCTLGLPYRVFRCSKRQQGPPKRVAYQIQGDRLTSYSALVGWGLAGCLADVGIEIDSMGERAQKNRTERRPEVTN